MPDILPSKTQQVQRHFSNIASRYDLANDILSFGLQRAWKRLADEAGLPFTRADNEHLREGAAARIADAHRGPAAGGTLLATTDPRSAGLPAVR